MSYYLSGCLECGIQCNPNSQLCRQCITRTYSKQEVKKEPKHNIPIHFVNLLLQTKETDRECSICKEIIKGDMYLSPCFHLFHLKCVNGQKTCPNCRKKI